MALKDELLTAAESIVTWSIASLPQSDKQLLFVGYSRHYYDRLIPSDIIHIIGPFYCHSKTCVQDIHNMNERALQPILSPAFRFDDFQWYLEFWPRYNN